MKKLKWQLYPSYLIVIIISITTAVYYISVSAKNFYIDNSQENLKNNAFLIKNEIEKNFSGFESVQEVSEKWYFIKPIRVTIISIDGVVVIDTTQNISEMDNHLNREEIIAAKEGGVGSAVRYSQTLNKDMLYVAMPIQVEKKMVGYVRVSLSIATIHEITYYFFFKIIAIIILCSLGAITMSFIMANKITVLLKKIELGAEKFAEGDFSNKLEVPKYKEVASLVNALNKMARQLENKILEILQRQNEHEAVLTSMVEGVIAVDKSGCIININQAAQKLFCIENNNIKGRPFTDVLFNDEIKQLIEQILKNMKSVEKDIILGKDNPKILQTRSIVLQDQSTDETTMGGLVVLNDVTRLRKLEQMRREFVANVSHELRTPITSIKGFVETLLDGAVNDKEQALHFLKIVARQSDRLHFIIEDILTLSRIEQGSEIGISFFRSPIKEVVANAIEMCELRAKEKDILIVFECSEEKIEGTINPELLEQAVINLIDNAIKYSPPNKKIFVYTKQISEKIIIEIHDQGRGIATEHLPRLFERFYRIDKARSRELGGTGLGLAIVKHIVLAHKGEIQVESTPEKGSKFTIILNKPQT